MDLNRAFPYKVCINLDRRTDRWEQMRTRFEQHEIYDVRRFSAVDGQQSTVPPSWSSTPGAYGCLLSHLRIVHLARELGEPSVLIFEDDVVFDENLQEKFSSYIQQLPSDWDILYFGALHLDDLIDISDNIHRIRRACSTYAYALNRTMYDAFIELHSRFNGPVDVINQVLQTQHACYTALCLTWPGWTNTSQMFKTGEASLVSAGVVSALWWRYGSTVRRHIFDHRV
jgi:GR25 family glycosyltransferase involved in LPS biosynthesis